MNRKEFDAHGRRPFSLLLLLALPLCLTAFGQRALVATSSLIPQVRFDRGTPPNVPQLLVEKGASPIAPTIAEKPAEVSAAKHGMISNTLAQLPLSFEPNRGQSTSDVRFLTRAPGYLLQLTATEMRLIVKGASEHPRRARMGQPSEHSTDEEAETPKAHPHALTLTWLDANRNAEVAPEFPLSGTVNYFKGKDSSKWHTNIPTFKQVRYKEMYPGIDLVYYGNGCQLQYDLIVAPGADPTPARLTLEGAQLRLTGNGDLDLTLSDGRRLQLRAPIVYQEHNGERVMVEAHYRISRHGDTSEIAFQIAAYDTERPLIIDPLVYSTFLGGSGQDRAFGVAVNAAGEAFVTGETDDAAIDFPTTAGAFDTTHNSGQDAFVTRVNAAGNALIYSTFLGGSGGIDRGLGIAVNAAGEAFVTGQTQGGFPTTAGAFDTTHNGGFNDAFVAKLNAAGSALLYSTYLGGGAHDVGWGIAVNAAGEAFVTGETVDAAIDFPTTPGAFDTTHNAFYDAFVAKLNAAGSVLIYSTFLGGSYNEDGDGIAVNAAGEAFVTGWTSDAAIDFPTTAGAFSTVHNGNDDAFVAKLNAAGTALVYSTFLGGGAHDYGARIAVNAVDEAFVTGYTNSDGGIGSGTPFQTTAGAFNITHNGGGYDAFVTKLNAAGSAPVYSTFLGGSDGDSGSDLAVNAADEAFVTGVTGSTNFPTTAGAFDTTYNGAGDAFVVKLNVAGSAPVYSTFLGGSGYDVAHGIAVTGDCGAFVTGATGDAVTPFPTTAAAFDPTYNGGPLDAVVAKIGSAGPCCVSPPSGMVSWWPADGNANDIADGNHGVLQGNAVFAPGMVGSAFSFAAQGDYVAVSSAANLNSGSGGDLSIDAWIETSSQAQVLPIVDKRDLPSGPFGSQAIGYTLFLFNGRLAFQLGDGIFFNYISSGPDLRDGQFHHVAVSVDRTSHTGGNLYVNGVLVFPVFDPTNRPASLTNNKPLFIGRHAGDPTIYFSGVIDEIEIFNRALDQQEIRDIFNAGSAGKCRLQHRRRSVRH